MTENIDAQSLPFVKERLHLLNSGKLTPQEEKHREDTTMRLVALYLELSKKLRSARAETLQYCEARPAGIGDHVSLDVVDREAFDKLQSQIQQHTNKLYEMEGALIELDTLSEGKDLWYSDLESMIGRLESTESNHRRRLSGVASAALARVANKGDKTPEQLLSEDQRYLTLAMPATAISGHITNVDWPDTLGGTPQITIKNDGNEAAQYYVQFSVQDPNDKWHMGACYPSYIIEPHEESTMWPSAV